MCRQSKIQFAETQKIILEIEKEKTEKQMTTIFNDFSTLVGSC